MNTHYRSKSFPLIHDLSATILHYVGRTAILPRLLVLLSVPVHIHSANAGYKFL